MRLNRLLSISKFIFGTMIAIGATSCAGLKQEPKPCYAVDRQVLYLEQGSIKVVGPACTTYAYKLIVHGTGAFVLYEGDIFEITDTWPKRILLGKGHVMQFGLAKPDTNVTIKLKGEEL